jgi:flagellar motor switch protein FliN
MMTYLDCWANVATALLSQALSGEPELVESLPKPLTSGSFGFAATVSGDESGRFSVVLDASILDTPLVGEGVDQKAGWAEILKEVADAAAGELLAKTGHKCRVESFETIESENKVSRAFQLQSGNHAWTILVRDEVRVPRAAAAAPAAPPISAPPQQFGPAQSGQAQSGSAQAVMASGQPPGQASSLTPGLTPGQELLLDVELDASLRFGCREMPLGEILELGPGDVVQLDRHVADPVDLLVGDKIVARGEVVLVNGSFGLRVTEVSSPKKRLESIRCLF